MSFPDHAWIDGITEMGEPIWIRGISIKQITGFNHLEGSANVFLKGDFEVKAKLTETIFVHAITSSSPLIIPEWNYILSYDGTIERRGNDKERKGIYWENSQGKANLIDNYEYVSGGEDNKDVSIRIRTNSLFLTIIPEEEMEIKELLIQLPTILYEDLRLLSFIGRKRIICSEASVRVQSENNTSHAFARYKTWGGFYNLPADQGIMRSLLKPNALHEGVFKNLIENYRKSEYKAVIDRTIPYLITSYEDGYLETHLINAYAALESMVDGIGSTLNQEYLTGNNQFKKFSKIIEERIRVEIEDPEIAEGIIKKIPELRRRIFLDRLLNLITNQGVNTNLIWPPNTDEAKEFQNLIKRRNLLIHQGILEPGNSCLYDLNRVQKLVELWILKLLDCPVDAINEFGLWRGAPINELLN